MWFYLFLDHLKFHFPLHFLLCLLLCHQLLYPVQKGIKSNAQLSNLILCSGVRPDREIPVFHTVHDIFERYHRFCLETGYYNCKYNGE